MRYEAEKFASGDNKDKDKTFTNSKHSFGQKDEKGNDKRVPVETVVKFKQFDTLDEVETELSASGERDKNLLDILNNVSLKEQKRGVAAINLGNSATSDQVKDAMEKYPTTWTLLSIIADEEGTRRSAKQDVDNIKTLFAKMQSGEISQEEFLREQGRILGFALPTA
jgi:hypothetical protein